MPKTAFSWVLHKPQIMSHLLMGQCLGPAPEAAVAEHAWRWNKAASETASLLLAYREPGRWCCEALAVNRLHVHPPGQGLSIHQSQSTHASLRALSCMVEIHSSAEAWLVCLTKDRNKRRVGGADEGYSFLSLSME